MVYRYTKWPNFFPLWAFWDINPPKGLRPIPVLAQRLDRLGFFLGRAPEVAIYPGCVLAWVFCHSSDRQSFGAKRVGEEML